MHKVGDVVPHKDDIIHLLAQVEHRHQQHRDRNATRETGQGRQHDEHEHDARRPQQGRVGEERALQDARDEGREQDAPQQRDAAVFFLHGRADDQQQEHVVQKMVPAAVAQHMAEQPDIEQRIFQRRAVDTEQMGRCPAAGPLPQEQHPQ